MNLERWSLRLWWIQRMLNRQQPLDVELLQRCWQSVAFSKKPKQIEYWQVQRIYSRSTSEINYWSSFAFLNYCFLPSLDRIIHVCFPVSALFSMCLLAGKGLINSFCFLSRYALARNIWMEILLKLSAVALVTLIEVVRNEAVVKLCLGVTVGTAAIISLTQPYLQPQINRLQCVCFICLSATAVGFAFNQRWLSRAALCLPFVFAAWQLRRHRDGKGERVKACSTIGFQKLFL